MKFLKINDNTYINLDKITTIHPVPSEKTKGKYVVVIKLQDRQEFSLYDGMIFEQATELVNKLIKYVSGQSLDIEIYNPFK